MTLTKNVLLLVNSRDPHATRLISALGIRGVHSIRIDIDSLPQGGWCSLSIGQGAGETIRLPALGAGVQAVFYRRLSSLRGRALWSHIPEELRDFVIDENECALLGLCGILSDANWVNDYKMGTKASVKAVQLHVASQVGILIPPTLITNNPDDVRAFYDRYNQDIIFKPLSVPVIKKEGPLRSHVYTSTVSAEHIAQIDRIRLTPGIFQQRIQKRHELRVTVIDESFFVARVETMGPARIDWRKGLSDGTTNFFVDDIPTPLQDKLLLVMKHLGIRFGAIDLIVTPEGDHVFLEVNPQGSYLWLEDQLGLPITQRIADALIG